MTVNDWGFDMFKHESEGISKKVFFAGDGPPVIIIHELPGMVSECISFAERVIERGYTVYLPLLFGRPKNRMIKALWPVYPVMMCIRRELYLFSKNTSSPVMSWLRNLGRSISKRHGNAKTGVIGMCMTGGFVIPMMLDEPIVAPVMSQPAFPVKDDDLGISPEVLVAAQKRAKEGVSIKTYRFKADRVSTQGKIDVYKTAFGDALLYYELEGKEQAKHKKGCHAVFTIDYIEEKGSETELAFNDLIRFFDERLK